LGLRVGLGLGGPGQLARGDGVDKVS
jgi:hypothetical protein